MIATVPCYLHGSKLTGNIPVRILDYRESNPFLGEGSIDASALYRLKGDRNSEASVRRDSPGSNFNKSFFEVIIIYYLKFLFGVFQV